jgi:hypothetical protein
LSLAAHNHPFLDHVSAADHKHVSVKPDSRRERPSAQKRKDKRKQTFNQQISPGSHACRKFAGDDARMATTACTTAAAKLRLKKNAIINLNAFGSDATT